MIWLLCILAGPVSDPNTKVLILSELSQLFSVSPAHSCCTRGFRAPSSLLHVINHTISEILGENRAVFYQVPPSSLSCASELDSFQKCLSRVKLRDWHSPAPHVIRDQHPRRLQLLPGFYWSQTLQPLPWVLLGKLVPNHPAPSYSIKNVYNPVNSNISAACYGGKRSLGEKGGKKKEKVTLPLEMLAGYRRRSQHQENIFWYDKVS